MIDIDCVFEGREDILNRFVGHRRFIERIPIDAGGEDPFHLLLKLVQRKAFFCLMPAHQATRAMWR